MTKYQTIIISVFQILITFGLKGQESPINSSKIHFENAKDELYKMLSGELEYNFKRAVFITENAYYDNELDYDEFCNTIATLANWANGLTERQGLIYDGTDREIIKKYSALFLLMTDTIRILTNTNKIAIHLPFTYDFVDFNGTKDWSKMFVTKLLKEHTGNCHSLPALYKILAEEMNVPAYLALAPNHIYIKLRSEKNGWFNTELTSGNFPIDAWLMASGYIHIDAIKNGIYMDTLSQKQSIALCMTDLAKGYQKKFGNGDGKFILESCDTVLKYYPNYVNALLLKAESQKSLLAYAMKQSNAKYISELFIYNSWAESLFNDMEQTYVRIHKLGYKKMPEEMYLNWLVSLNQQKEKYTNKKILPTIENTSKNE